MMTTLVAGRLLFRKLFTPHIARSERGRYPNPNVDDSPQLTTDHFFSDKQQAATLMKMRLMIVAVAVACLMQPQLASAQVDFLKGLFGGKVAPAHQAKSFQPFRGHQALSQAIVEAVSGNLAKSLTLASEAFKGGGVNDPLEHPESLTISPNVLRLSKAWAAKGVKPDEVVAVLIEVVLPSKTPGVVRPYVGQWPLNYDELYLSRPNGRVVAPESVAADLIRWAVLGASTTTVRLKALLEATTAAVPVGTCRTNRCRRWRPTSSRQKRRFIRSGVKWPKGFCSNSSSIVSELNRSGFAIIFGWPGWRRCSCVRSMCCRTSRLMAERLDRARSRHGG